MPASIAKRFPRATKQAKSPAPVDKRFAKDVAAELDKRQRRRVWIRRTLIVGGGLTAVILALLYLRFGGKGKGLALPSGQVVPIDSTQACALRLSSTGLTANGVTVTQDQAIAVCKQSRGAIVLITGDAREGDWESLRDALIAAGISYSIGP